MNRDTHHRRAPRAAARPHGAAARLTTTSTHHRRAPRAVAEAVQVAVLEAEEVRGAGAPEAPEAGVEASGSAISMNMVRGVEAPEAGLAAVQAVAREAAQVAVLEAVAVARARVEVVVRVVQAVAQEVAVMEVAEAILGQNRITTSSKPSNAPMT
jgi:hypothetical protein